MALACISKGCPFAGDGTMIPSASTAQPAVSRSSSCALPMDPGLRRDGAWGGRTADVSRSIARLGRERRQLKLVRPARFILGVQVPVGLGNLDRIDDQVAAVLVARQCAAAGGV